MANVTLYYRLPADPKASRRILKVARAIVAGHERVSTIHTPPIGGAKALLKNGVLRVTIPAQTAEAAHEWIRFSHITPGNPADLPDRDMGMYNVLTLIWRSGSILCPDDGPNGGYKVKNGGCKAANSTVIPKAKCRGMKIV